jgi:flagellin-like hook-associated protein FlgL
MDKKGILTKIKELFSTEVEKFEADYKTQDGRIIRCYGEGLDVGEMVKEITAEGEMDIEDGDYILEDGTTLMIVGGKIEAIGEEVSEDEMEEITDTITEDVEMGNDMKDRMEDGYKNEIDTKLLDGTEIRVLTKGDAISVGDMVLVKVGEGYKEAPEGRHEVEGGLVVYTDAEGNINEIETAQTEERDETGLSEVFTAISTLVDEVKSLRGELSTIKKENEELKTRVNKFAAEPSVEPLPTKVEFKSKSKADILAFMSKR